MHTRGYLKNGKEETWVYTGEGKRHEQKMGERGREQAKKSQTPGTMI
jgi:hypothetical protein